MRVTLKHPFRCGYFCRYCGKFNISSGYTKRDFHIDQDDYDVDWDAFRAMDVKEMDTSQSKDNERKIPTTIKWYNHYRDEVNINRKLGYFNLENGLHSMEGTCDGCGKTQPWAEPWKIRKQLKERIVDFCLGVLDVIGIILLLILAFAGGIAGLIFSGFLGMPLLSFIMHIISERREAPHIEARSKAIHEKMKDSPFYKQSYPYVARADNSLDLTDKRAQRMIAALSKPESASQKRTFTCDNCSATVDVGLQMQGTSCWCPKCGELMAEKEIADADQENQSSAAVPAVVPDVVSDSPAWVCANCRTSNHEGTKTCRGCGLTKAWTDSRLERLSQLPNAESQPQLPKVESQPQLPKKEVPEESSGTALLKNIAISIVAGGLALLLLVWYTPSQSEKTYTLTCNQCGESIVTEDRNANRICSDCHAEVREEQLQQALNGPFADYDGKYSRTATCSECGKKYIELKIITSKPEGSPELCEDCDGVMSYAEQQQANDEMNRRAEIGYQEFLARIAEAR